MHRPRSLISRSGRPLHVILRTRLSPFSACNIENVGVAWGRGYLRAVKVVSASYCFLLPMSIMSDSPDIGSSDAPLQSATVACSDRPQDKRRWKNLFCPHCDQEVSKTTFYQHKRRYYDRRAKRWDVDAGRNFDRELEVDNISSSDEEGSGQSIDLDPPTSIEGVTT